MKNILICSIAVVLLSLYVYNRVGTSDNISAIKKLAPLAFSERNWKIIRYDGFKYGSWSKHGGTVWYHVANIDNPAVQYSVHVALWGNELQFYYYKAEIIPLMKN
jgi:hypothetical protein